MSGGDPFSPWNLHADAEAEAHIGGLRQPSSESDFFSGFFGPELTPAFTARTTTAAAGTTAVTNAMNVGVSGGGGEEEVESSGAGREGKLNLSATAGKRIQEDCENRPSQKRKRHRTTEMHNMTERRRRDKIKGKLKALQELIPNSHKLDKATLLDEAIAYVKTLQLQVQNMHSNKTCISSGAMHCLHMPHYPFSHMGMGYGMGMTGMGRGVHSPLMSMPSPVRAANMVPMPGFSTIPTYCPLSHTMPFASLPDCSAAGIPTLPSPPVLHAGPFSSHRGEASSQAAAQDLKTNVSEAITSTC